MFESREPFEFYLQSDFTFFDKGFYTLNDYPESKISHVMILFINTHLQLSNHVKKC